jgi:hypothetical protein
VEGDNDLCEPADEAVGSGESRKSQGVGIVDDTDDRETLDALRDGADT